MGRALKWTSEQKLPLVVSILRGEGSVAEIGRRHQVSDAMPASVYSAGRIRSVRAHNRKTAPNGMLA